MNKLNSELHGHNDENSSKYQCVTNNLKSDITYNFKQNPPNKEKLINFLQNSSLNEISQVLQQYIQEYHITHFNVRMPDITIDIANEKFTYHWTTFNRRFGILKLNYSRDGELAVSNFRENINNILEELTNISFSDINQESERLQDKISKSKTHTHQRTHTRNINNQINNYFQNITFQDLQTDCLNNAINIGIEKFYQIIEPFIVNNCISLDILLNILYQKKYFDYTGFSILREKINNIKNINKTHKIFKITKLIEIIRNNKIILILQDFAAFNQVVTINNQNISVNTWIRKIGKYFFGELNEKVMMKYKDKYLKLLFQIATGKINSQEEFEKLCKFYISKANNEIQKQKINDITLYHNYLLELIVQNNFPAFKLLLTNIAHSLGYESINYVKQKNIYVKDAYFLINQNVVNLSIFDITRIFGKLFFNYNKNKNNRIEYINKIIEIINNILTNKITDFETLIKFPHNITDIMAKPTNYSHIIKTNLTDLSLSNLRIITQEIKDQLQIKKFRTDITSSISLPQFKISQIKFVSFIKNLAVEIFKLKSTKESEAYRGDIVKILNGISDNLFANSEELEQYIQIIKHENSIKKLFRFDFQKFLTNISINDFSNILKNNKRNLITNKDSYIKILIAGEFMIPVLIKNLLEHYSHNSMQITDIQKNIYTTKNNINNLFVQQLFVGYVNSSELQLILQELKNIKKSGHQIYISTCMNNFACAYLGCNSIVHAIKFKKEIGRIWEGLINNDYTDFPQIYQNILTKNNKYNCLNISNLNSFFNHFKL